MSITSVRCRACNQSAGGVQITNLGGGRVSYAPMPSRDRRPQQLVATGSMENAQRLVLRAHHNWGQCPKGAQR